MPDIPQYGMSAFDPAGDVGTEGGSEPIPQVPRTMLYFLDKFCKHRGKYCRHARWANLLGLLASVTEAG